MYVVCATKDSHIPHTCQHTAVSILVKNHTSAMCVRRSLLLPQACQYIAASIQVNRHMSAMYVRRVLVGLDPLRYI